MPFVVEKENREVRIHGADGSFETAFRLDGWREPYAVAVDAAGFIYVLDRGLKRVDVFDSFGVIRWTLGPMLPGGIELRDEVTHINGTEVRDHAAATALVRAAAREVVFALRRTPTSMSPDVQRRLRQQRVLDAMGSSYRA